jgi:hypothetical protein
VEISEATLNGSVTFFREAIRLPIQIAALHLRVQFDQAPGCNGCRLQFGTPGYETDLLYLACLVGWVRHGIPKRREGTPSPTTFLGGAP